MKESTMKMTLLPAGLLLAGILSLQGCVAPQATQDLSSLTTEPELYG